ncbi:hypothetical protein ACOME3_002344 [Neoechinorhynchus agilis]
MKLYIAFLLDCFVKTLKFTGLSDTNFSVGNTLMNMWSWCSMPTTDNNLTSIVEDGAAKMSAKVHIITVVVSLFAVNLYSISAHWLGFKKCLLIALIGNTLVDGCRIFMVFALKNEYIISLIYAIYFMQAAAGGLLVINHNSNSYLATICQLNGATDTVRTIRFGILESCVFVGMICGQLFVSFALDKIRLVYIMTVAFGATLFSTFYALLFLMDEKKVNGFYEPSKGNKEMKKSFNVKSFVKHILLAAGFGKDADDNSKRRRTYIVLYFSILLLVALFSTVQQSCLYIFLRTGTLQLSDKEYGMFTAIHLSLSAIGLLVILPFLKKVINLSDHVLVLISAFAETSNLLIISLARDQKVLYASWGGAAFAPYHMPAIKCLLTMLVDKSEIITLFSCFTFIVGIANFAGVFIFQTIYLSTIQTFPGLVLMIGAGLAFLIVPLM